MAELKELEDIVVLSRDMTNAEAEHFTCRGYYTVLSDANQRKVRMCRTTFSNNMCRVNARCSECSERS